MSAANATETILNLRRRSGAGPSDWQAYHAILEGLLQPGMTVVDVGCGAGRVEPFPWEQPPRVHLIGLDPDPAAHTNPALDEFLLLQPGNPWPLEPQAADLVLARYVFEHVADPADFLKQAHRALKPGGGLAFLTPNRRHPAMLASAALPLPWKRRILGRTRRTSQDEVFQTYYRMNAPSALSRQLAKAGFAVERLEACELEPCGYLAFAAPAYAAACAWYAFMRWSGLERALGAHILGVARRLD